MSVTAILVSRGYNYYLYAVRGAVYRGLCTAAVSCYTYCARKKIVIVIIVFANVLQELPSE